jgi:hypothetical protein
MHDNDVASSNGPNGITLGEGQRRYRRYGTSALHLVGKVRRPLLDEPPDPEWRPLARPAGEDESQYFLSDLGQLLMAASEDALQAARRSRSDLEVGRLEGLRSALVLLIKQANAFGIPRHEIGVDTQFDLGRDMVLDPPPGYFAG